MTSESALGGWSAYTRPMQGSRETYSNKARPLLLLLLVFCSEWNLSCTFLTSSQPGLYRERGIVMKLGFKEPNKGNNPSSNIYVDKSCVNCGVCRWMCPEVFKGVGLRSIVGSAPQGEEQLKAAYQAMVSCPVGAIRLYRPDRYVKKVIEEDFPIPVDAQNLPGVYHLGYHHRDTLGATPYFIVRPSGGNIMIDCPRFNARLADQLADLGGVDFAIFTHKDTVEGQLAWKREFPKLQRIIHRFDATSDINFEARLNGKGPWSLGDDIQILYVPGHTLGSIAVLYNSTVDSALFSGDHIGWSEKLARLDGFSRFNRAGLETQAESMEKLTEYEFQWILPAQGMRYRFQPGVSKENLLNQAATRFVQDGKQYI